MARVPGALQPPDEGFPVRLKVWVLGGLVLLMFGILTAQLVRLQLLKHEEYSARADINRVRSFNLAPARGLIYARDGTALVENAAAYRILLVAADIPDGEEARIATAIAAVFEVSAWEIEQAILSRKASNDPFLPFVISDDPSDSAVLDLTTRRRELPGIVVETVSERRYEHAELLAHILGFVNWITEEEYAELAAERYLYSDKIGQTGLEASYESVLRGAAGRRQIEVDAIGRELRVLNAEDPVPGHSLVLTIDLELQARVQEILERNIGASLFAASVVLDVRTGEVLALVSIPTYDLNIYNDGLSAEEWTALIEDPGQPCVTTRSPTSSRPARPSRW